MPRRGANGNRPGEALFAVFPISGAQLDEAYAECLIATGARNDGLKNTDQKVGKDGRRREFGQGSRLSVNCEL